ncbi:hypothetical protein BD626DRAFT_573575 [Schizophyllum amplum]|uniref:Uncharacterized protein n=1 Tax=Schizophyllum amplum TaxID=97359 RepID=A0A550C0M6_9AGAR|nr:hypothetical protein BD626DRAFT_573575 [Auriculariopsis ampla]
MFHFPFPLVVNIDKRDHPTASTCSLSSPTPAPARTSSPSTHLYPYSLKLVPSTLRLRLICALALSSTPSCPQPWLHTLAHGLVTSPSPTLAPAVPHYVPSPPSRLRPPDPNIYISELEINASMDGLLGFGATGKCGGRCGASPPTAKRPRIEAARSATTLFGTDMWMPARYR